MFLQTPPSASLWWRRSCFWESSPVCLGSSGKNDRPARCQRKSPPAHCGSCSLWTALNLSLCDSTQRKTTTAAVDRALPQSFPSRPMPLSQVMGWEPAGLQLLCWQKHYISLPCPPVVSNLRLEDRSPKELHLHRLQQGTDRNPRPRTTRPLVRWLRPSDSSRQTGTNWDEFRAEKPHLNHRKQKSQFCLSEIILSQIYNIKSLIWKG